VILLSLLIASVGLPPLLAGMHFPDEPEERRQEDLARREAAHAAIQAVEEAQIVLMETSTDPDLFPQAAARVIALYRHRLEELGDSHPLRNEVRKLDGAECALRLAALEAERETVFALGRNLKVSDEISRKLVREIDLQEAGFR